MAFQRFFIGPYTDGKVGALRPWLIPEASFARLSNAYVYRGRVRKRVGAHLLNEAVDESVAHLYSRLRVNIDTTDGSGYASGTVPGTIFKVGQMFSVGDQVFTVNATGTPANMLSTGAATATFNTTTGAYAITGADATTDVYFYTGTPVMGFTNYENTAINDEPTFAFDQQFAYEFTAGAWERLGTGIWTGSDSQFFWSTNWRGANSYDYILFVTNYNAADGIQYWNGSTWATLNPNINAVPDTLVSARIILPFKDRLVCLNTIEYDDANTTNRTYVNRCRFSQNGSPLASNAWLEDTPGLGGFIDAPTREAIITAEFVKDRLIVYFERSTWELVYTNNQVLPFVWQQINTELGAESTFSVVPFDKVALGVGNVGIHACNGANVERIDQAIPDDIFQIHNGNNGVFRVCGIRDYTIEYVYWAYPDSATDSTYPDRMLVFNYETGAWATNDDSITAFGYFQNVSDTTWATAPFTWAQGIGTWNSGTLQSEFRQVIAGNQQGFTFIVDPTRTKNSPALYINDITGTNPNYTLEIEAHNLTTDDFILIENLTGTLALTQTIYQVAQVIDANAIAIFDPQATDGTYLGNGVATRVSRIDILTKAYNPFGENGQNVYLGKLDMYMDNTQGEFTIDTYVSTSNQSMLLASESTGTLIGTNIVTTGPEEPPLEQSQLQFWHPVYLQAEGEVVQVRMYLSDEQMIDEDIALVGWTLNAMILYAMPTEIRLA